MEQRHRRSCESAAPARWPYIAAIAFAVFALSACSGKDDGKSAQTTPAAKTPGTSVAAATAKSDDPIELAGAKLAIYVDCYNRFDHTGHDMMETYAKWVHDLQVDPTGKEDVILGVGSEFDPARLAKCSDEFKQTAAEPPTFDKLDPAGAAYIAAVNALATVANNARPYYERQDYKDDQFAKGKQMHAGLVASYKVFADASHVFSTELEAENEKMLAAELAQVEKTEGRKLHYWKMTTMSQAKQLVNVIGEDEFAIDAAHAKLASFEQAADESSAYAKAHADETSTTWRFMQEDVEKFRVAAKERVRRIRDKTPYTHGEVATINAGGGQMGDGTVEKAVAAYNGLVNSSNNVN